MKRAGLCRTPVSANGPLRNQELMRQYGWVNDPLGVEIDGTTWCFVVARSSRPAKSKIDAVTTCQGMAIFLQWHNPMITESRWTAPHYHVPVHNRNMRCLVIAL